MSKRTKDTRSIGFEGENYAEKILKNEGYKILQKNFYTKFGEIDIIAKDNDTLVFVEVKLRRSIKYGMPEESVDAKKLQKIQKAGLLYLKQKKVEYKKLRIDVISLLLHNNVLIRERLIKGVYLW